MLQHIDHPSSGIIKGLILTSGLVNHVGESVLELLDASLHDGLHRDNPNFRTWSCCAAKLRKFTAAASMKQPLHQSSTSDSYPSTLVASGIMCFCCRFWQRLRC